MSSAGIFDVIIDREAEKRINRALVFLDQQVVGRVLARSINKTLRGITTDLSKSVPRSYNVRKKDVMRSFSTRQAAIGNLEARAISTGRPRPLSAFGLSPASPGGSRRKGFSVKVRNQRKRIGTPFFVAGMEAGHIGTVHIGIYRRMTRERYPVKQAYGPSIPQMVGSPDVTDETIERSLRIRFLRVFRQEMNFERQKKLGLL